MPLTLPNAEEMAYLTRDPVLLEQALEIMDATDSSIPLPEDEILNMDRTWISEVYLYKRIRDFYKYQHLRTFG